MAMTLPVRVRGGEATGATWEEVTSCVDVGPGGVGMLMSRDVGTGQVLHLSVPLPSRFRQYDIIEDSYRVYALVRSAQRLASRSRVGVMFLGRRPPKASAELSADRYRIPGDPARAPARPRPRLRLHLDAEQAPGGVAHEEDVVAENLGPRVALVGVTRLPVSRGALLAVEEVGGDFRTRAEVHSISIGTDGRPRLSLRFLDAPVPDRLLQADGTTTGS
jgi:hypothetical protein